MNRFLRWLMWLLLGVYIVGLARHGPGFSALVDGWLGILVEVVPAAVCWIAYSRGTPRRPELAYLGAALTFFAAGNAYYILALSNELALPFPSLADPLYLAFYPPVLIAIGIAARRELSGLAMSMWWDSALGGLGAAAVLAVVLGPVLASATMSGSVLGVWVSVAYPLFDLLLVGTLVGICALHGARMPWHWLPLMAGLLVFAAADVIYAIRLGNDSYVVGTTLDAGWAAAITLIAVWALDTLPPDQASARQDREVALAVPALATGAALAVLVAGTTTHVSIVAVGLAGLTLLAAAGRTQQAFRQLLRLAEIRRQAGTDDLTDLPNRRAFYEQVPAALATAARVPRALLVLDLDKFKEVNDSLGHHVGDQLLVQVAFRLRDHLRAGDLLARLGGDEFAILLTDADRTQAEAVAAKLRARILALYTLDGITLRTDVSIGIALSPDHGADLGLLLRHADIAMYRAKTARTGHCVYTGSEDHHGESRLRTLEELRTALAEQQLIVHYQPKIDLATGAVRGAEALVRWEHPTRGLLYPDSFLDLVEDAGLMRAMTQRVLVLALDQATAWRAAGRGLTVAVNLSASSLIDADLPAQIFALLAERNVPASTLLLEITEEFLMTDRGRARSILIELRASGIQIAVDDFGTGYSSLAYLRDLPIDELKLDRSFIRPMAADARAAALVASTIGLAHSLGLRMVAEGVEDRATHTQLVRLGCDQAQGFHFSRPVPARELDAWMAVRAAGPGVPPGPWLLVS